MKLVHIVLLVGILGLVLYSINNTVKDVSPPLVMKSERDITQHGVKVVEDDSGEPKLSSQKTPRELRKHPEYDLIDLRTPIERY
jgi:hypothetical protein